MLSYWCFSHGKQRYKEPIEKQNKSVIKTRSSYKIKRTEQTEILKSASQIIKSMTQNNKSTTQIIKSVSQIYLFPSV